MDRYNVRVISGFELGRNITTSKPCEFYIDTIPSEPKQCIRVLWVAEPNEVSGLRNHVIYNRDKFDLILTHDPEILKMCPNSTCYPFGTTWIRNFDLAIEKEYCVTSLIGAKNFLPNQSLRQQLPSLLDDIKNIPIHLWNSRNQPFFSQGRMVEDRTYKNELFYSQFHIAIENVSTDNYFTEKLIDCFQTKTIPIYIGCPNVEKYFDKSGMFHVMDLYELREVVKQITPATYRTMLEAIENNYQRSLPYANFRETLDNIITVFVDSQ